MLCKELQIGDWITDNHGFRWQITVVGEDYAYATFEGNEGDPWEFDDKDDRPQPIEITDEVLKANGWKPHKTSLPRNLKDYYYTKDMGRNHLIWNRGILSMWLDYQKDNEGVYSDIFIPVKYVHQLQQVLRLAGLTDLANNFKI